MKTFSRDERWRTCGPQTLNDLHKFTGRVAKLKAEKGISDKKAVQQDLVNTARKDLRKQGIPEFECSFL